MSVTETELLRRPLIRSEACACGLTIHLEDPTPARVLVACSAHVTESTHRAWSDHYSWFPRPSLPDPTVERRPVDLSRATPMRPVRWRRPRGRLAHPIGVPARHRRTA